MAKTAFIFSGQGAQFPGMMKEIYDAIPESRRVFDIADQTLGRPVSELCFYGTQEELNLTHNTQPCVLAADLAAYEATKALGYSADGYAGFSLGEYAALVASGVLGLEDAFRIVQQRADLMQEAVPVGTGAMAAVMKVDLERIDGIIHEVDGYVDCANFNSPGQTVVSGEAKAVEQFVQICRDRKMMAVLIPVSVPAHCEMLAPAADKLDEVLNNVEMRDPSLPIYMNVDAGPVVSSGGIREKMVAQVKSPLLWVDTLHNMWGDGFTNFIECGPGKTLTGFVKKTLPDAVAATYDKLD